MKMKLRCTSQVESGEVGLSFTYAKIEDKDGLKSQMSANLFQKKCSFGNDESIAPIRPFEEGLIAACGERGQVRKFQPFAGFWQYVRQSCCEALQPQRWESL